uniref:Uncharacterized protein n=1 Tax=Arundo donax TaxID=35708 RepID=A0A0A9HJQ3_ARUDO
MEENRKLRGTNIISPGSNLRRKIEGVK